MHPVLVHLGPHPKMQTIMRPRHDVDYANGLPNSLEITVQTLHRYVAPYIDTSSRGKPNAIGSGASWLGDVTSPSTSSSYQLCGLLRFFIVGLSVYDDMCGHSQSQIVWYKSPWNHLHPVQNNCVPSQPFFHAFDGMRCYYALVCPNQIRIAYPTRSKEYARPTKQETSQLC